MQMVSASKYARAERELKPARVYGTGAKAVFEAAQLEQDESKPNHLIIAISSDRGLCGGIHSGVAKAIKAYIGENPDANTKLVVCGDKVKAALRKTHGPHILCAFNELGRKPPLFEEASFIAEQIVESGYEFDVCKVLYNKFKSAISYEMTPQPIHSFTTLTTAETMLRTECSHVSYGQCHEECGRHDRRTSNCVQQNPTGRHHDRTHRDYLRLCGSRIC